MTESVPLWTPSDAFTASQPLTHFIEWCAAREGHSFADYDAFYDWSVKDRKHGSILPKISSPMRERAMRWSSAEKTRCRTAGPGRA